MDDCHICAPRTGYIHFAKNDRNYWELYQENRNLSNLGEWGNSPKYKLLKLQDDSFGILVEYAHGGGHGYFNYTCELYDLSSDNKIFFLNRLNDSTGAVEDNQSVSLKTKVYTQKSVKNGYLLCVSSKGNIERKVKVNKIEYFKFSEDNEFYFPVQKSR